MDELIKFLTSKIGYTITAILGFGLPGNIFIFVWDKELYLQIDVAKLLILSFGISFALSFINLIPCLVSGAVFVQLFEKNVSATGLALTPVAFTAFELIFGIAMKIFVPDYSITDFIEEIAKIMLVYLIAMIIANILIFFINKCMKR